MKLLTFIYEGKEQSGVLSLDGTEVYSFEKLQQPFKNMEEAIRSMNAADIRALQSLCDMLKGQGIAMKDIQKCAPIPCPAQDIICLGINYLAHAEESARYKKEAFERNRDYPVYFSKRVNRAVADGEAILSHGDILERLDYESELAVIIGKDTVNVKKENAWDSVFGYTIINDVSAREIQTRHKQWYFGKSLDGFCPMGPWIVTKDEMETPPVLKITSKVNGELRQNSTTDLLVFDIPYVIEELSHGMTLKAGTIISMGTPAGVGMGFNPPRFLKSGDVVECEIEKIGKITNIVK
ncbi:MAG: fumarylacetoacetate hydrolase family protein [Lachnospiraceae bacterium]|nr:fumarylacetoacetate hydrolase family protein [Lachnospiraceae bacterium]